ncbi:unnamed protein product [Porites evermanni]|uniref:E3 ubiquitin-protein ligase n=1 Tax=Porites evermanni TaxID=104178 RepID=A0ABN8LZV0_9CNID|nr:unnamed protein product [Porites evermanni]
MTKTLLEQKNFFQGTFSSQMSRLDEKLFEIDSSLVFSSDVLARENLPEILNVEEILDQRFQELSSEFRVNLNYSCVKYVPNDTSPSMNDVLGKLIFTKTDPMLTTANGKGLTEGTEDEVCSFKIETRNSQGQITYSSVDKVGVDIRSVDTGNFTLLIYVFSHNQISGLPVSLQSNRALTCNLCSYNSSKQMSSCFHHTMQSLGYCVSCQYSRDLGGRILFGDQPDGHMSWRTEPRNFLPGNEDYGTIIISCNFDRGVQGEHHPNPGVPYYCYFCTFYLPDNEEGRELSVLLRRAFNANHMFTIAENSIVRNGLELKTSLQGGPSNYGYPDPGYLNRLKRQLADKGFTLLRFA